MVGSDFYKMSFPEVTVLSNNDTFSKSIITGKIKYKYFLVEMWLWPRHLIFIANLYLKADAANLKHK